MASDLVAFPSRSIQRAEQIHEDIRQIQRPVTDRSERFVQDVAALVQAVREDVRQARSGHRLWQLKERVGAVLVLVEHLHSDIGHAQNQERWG